MRRARFAFACLALTLAALQGHGADLRDPAGGASWQRLRVQLPADRKNFSGGAGADVANARCLTCHSAEMILTQPTRTVAQWKDTVTKMRTAYGAPLEDAEIDVLAAYFANLQSTPPSAPATRPPTSR